MSADVSGKGSLGFISDCNMSARAVNCKAVTRVCHSEGNAHKRNVYTINVHAMLSQLNPLSPPHCCELTYIAGAQVGSFYGQATDTLYWPVISCLAAHNLGRIKA